MSEPTDTERESQERMESKFAESVREATQAEEHPDARRGSDYRPDCKACRDLVAHTRHVLDGDHISEAQAEFNPQPDLRTLKGELYFISSHELDQERKSAVITVTQNFEALLRNIWKTIPAGSGKTRALHAISRACMECNKAITNYGA